MTRARISVAISRPAKTAGERPAECSALGGDSAGTRHNENPVAHAPNQIGQITATISTLRHHRCVTAPARRVDQMPQRGGGVGRGGVHDRVPTGRVRSLMRAVTSLNNRLVLGLAGGSSTAELVRTTAQCGPSSFLDTAKARDSSSTAATVTAVRYPQASATAARSVR
jgi:hypothetical protein